MEVLLEKSFNIDESYERSHKIINLNIKDNMDKLVICFEYSPRIVKDKKSICKAFENIGDEMTEDEADYFKEQYLNNLQELKNLITISVYSGDDYIGCGHRGEEVQIITISKEFCTRGFKCTGVEKGNWQVVLSMHGVSTCIEGKIKICGE